MPQQCPLILCVISTRFIVTPSFSSLILFVPPICLFCFFQVILCLSLFISRGYRHTPLHLAPVFYPQPCQGWASLASRAGCARRIVLVSVVYHHGCGVEHGVTRWPWWPFCYVPLWRARWRLFAFFKNWPLKNWFWELLLYSGFESFDRFTYCKYLFPGRALFFTPLNKCS